MRYVVSFLLSIAIVLPVAAADNIDQLNTLSQTQFRQLSEDLGSTLSYKAINSAASLGIAGFDFGIEATATKLEHREAWDRAISGSGPSTLYVTKAHVHKGLPLGFDVGGFYAAVPDTNISLWGAELRYAIIQGGPATPALGLRGAYTKLSGVSQLELNTKSLELTLSKGFGPFTPYVGAGHVWTTSTPVGVSNVSKEEFGQTKYMVGGHFNLGIFNVAVETDKTGDAKSYGIKLGWRF